MPSGAKKRKAAKKKKGNQNQSNNSAHGDEGVKHHEDRESDVGEVSSPTSEDHQKLPMGGEDEEIEKASKEQVGVEESVVQVEKEIKIEDDEANRKSYDGGSSESSGSSSSSSSDDESHGIKKEQAESSITPVESVEVADSSSGKSVEPVCELPTAEAGDLIEENIPAANSDRITVSTRLVELDVPSPADIPVAPYVVEPTPEENEGTSEPSVNAASQEKEEANIQSSESTPTTLEPKECVVQENDDRSTSPIITPTVDVDNEAPQHMKDHVVTEPATFPYQVQKTSWKSCCGLFEVFSGSSA